MTPRTSAATAAPPIPHLATWRPRGEVPAPVAP
jgi:hypothetical protein